MDFGTITRLGQLVLAAEEFGPPAEPSEKQPEAKGEAKADEKLAGSAEDVTPTKSTPGGSVEVYYGTSDEYKNTTASPLQQSVPIHRMGVRGIYSIPVDKLSFGLGAGIEGGYGYKSFGDSVDSFTASATTFSIPLFLRASYSVYNKEGVKVDIIGQGGYSFPISSSDENRTGGSEGSYKREFESMWLEGLVGVGISSGRVGGFAGWNPLLFNDQRNIDGISETIKVEHPLLRFQLGLKFDL